VPETLEEVADRLAGLLVSDSGPAMDPGGSHLVFEEELELRPFEPLEAPAQVWAVDGGQALVADARCLQVVVTRASVAMFAAGACALEEEGELRAHLLGSVQGVAGLGLAEGTSVDVNLLRDHGEWEAVGRCVQRAQPGALVLVDGDLVPDWRLPDSTVADVLGEAEAKGVVVAGVTKHSSLARGSAPLVGQLEAWAEAALGERARWWVAVARSSRPAPLQVVVARLDPLARFAFRVDLPAACDPAQALGRLASVSDDAAFPGYPYPLAVADRLAGVAPWLRQELGLVLDEALESRGVPFAVRERAFADRHQLMERA
jgi:hypothetical protein